MVITVIGTLGSIASIITLIVYFRSENTRSLIKWLLGLIVFLSIATAAVSYQNYLYSSEERRMTIRKEEAKIEAQQILNSFPSYISRSEKGKNEGIVNIGVTYLDKYSDIYPLSSKRIMTHLDEDIQAAKADRESRKHEEIMETAAQAIVQMMNENFGDVDSYGALHLT